MKKLKLAGTVLLGLLVFSAVGCKTQEQPKTNTPNNTAEVDKNNSENEEETQRNSPRDKAIYNENEEKDNTEIDKRYKEVDKTKLDYEAESSPETYYETEYSVVSSKADVKKIDNKKYKEILKDYTYASEVNPTHITRKEAIELVKKVLPDDIKEIRRKYDESTSKAHIVYSSGQGNFIVGFAYDYDKTHSAGFNPDSDNEVVVGIDYLKEINPKIQSQQT